MTRQFIGAGSPREGRPFLLSRPRRGSINDNDPAANCPLRPGLSQRVPGCPSGTKRESTTPVCQVKQKAGGTGWPQTVPPVKCGAVAQMHRKGMNPAIGSPSQCWPLSWPHHCMLILRTLGCRRQSPFLPGWRPAGERADRRTGGAAPARLFLLPNPLRGKATM